MPHFMGGYPQGDVTRQRGRHSTAIAAGRFHHIKGALLRLSPLPPFAPPPISSPAESVVLLPAFDRYLTFVFVVYNDPLGNT